MLKKGTAQWRKTAKMPKISRAGFVWNRLGVRTVGLPNLRDPGVRPRRPSFWVMNIFARALGINSSWLKIPALAEIGIFLDFELIPQSLTLPKFGY
jgi:hypothetical protein